MGIIETAFYNWKMKFGDLGIKGLYWLCQLEEVNTKSC